MYIFITISIYKRVIDRIHDYIFIRYQIEKQNKALTNGHTIYKRLFLDFSFAAILIFYSTKFIESQKSQWLINMPSQGKAKTFFSLYPDVKIYSSFWRKWKNKNKNVLEK